MRYWNVARTIIMKHSYSIRRISHHFSEIESLRKENNEENSRLQKELDETPKVKLPTPKKKDQKDKKPRGRYTFSAEVLKSYGVDTSNLPEGAKAIVRKGKKDEWTIQLFYYSPAKVYTKVYRIGRFPQSTLNKYIHQIMDYLRVRLESLMLEVIRNCGFVQRHTDPYDEW